MIYYRGKKLQMIPNDVSYEAVTSLTSETFRSAEGMYLPTIGANWNGPLADFTSNSNR